MGEEKKGWDREKKGRDGMKLKGGMGWEEKGWCRIWRDGMEREGEGMG